MAGISSRIRHVLFDHFWLKISSLVVAVIIWISVTTQGRADKTFMDIPYELHNIPINLEVIDRGIGVVKVTARGPQSLIATIKPNDISIPIDLPDDVEPGNLQLEISPENVSIPYPNQISILQISPSKITVHLDETKIRTVPIRPLLKGAPAKGFVLGRWEVFPSRAQIKGPTSIVSTLEQILTESIDIDGAEFTFNERVNLKPANKFIKVLNPQRVTVMIEIKEKIIERTFPEFEFRILTPEPDPGIQIDTFVTVLKLSGPQRILSGLQPSDIDIVADCRDLGPGTHNVALQVIRSPEKITDFSLDPDHVTVEVPPSPQMSPTLPPNNAK